MPKRVALIALLAGLGTGSASARPIIVEGAVIGASGVGGMVPRSRRFDVFVNV